MCYYIHSQQQQEQAMNKIHTGHVALSAGIIIGTVSVALLFGHTTPAVHWSTMWACIGMVFLTNLLAGFK